MLSSVTYTGDGLTRIFTVPFGYLNRTDITVEVGGLPASYTWLTDTTIQMAVAPANLAVVKLFRATPFSTKSVTFIDNANLTERDLNRAVGQTFYKLQEVRDDLDFWVEYLQDTTISGGDLPPVGPSADNSFLVAGGSVWNVRSLANVKTILGLDAPVGPSYTLPAPSGFPGFVYTDGDNPYQLLGISDSRDFLNLGSLAIHNVGEYPILSVNPGVDNTSEGSVVFIVDAAGFPGLPAISGALLTHLPVPLYVRFDQTAAYNVDGGAYPVAATWTARDFTTIVTDEIGGRTISSGWAEIPAGKYTFRARTKMRVTGAMACRLVLQSGSLVQQGQTITGVGEEQALEVSGQMTIGAADGVKVEVYSTGLWADTRALGTAHGDAGLGLNRYTVLHLWKLP
jgi:hypothetical protein